MQQTPREGAQHGLQITQRGAKQLGNTWLQYISASIRLRTKRVPYVRASENNLRCDAAGERAAGMPCTL